MIPHILPSSSTQRPPLQPPRASVRTLITAALLASLALSLPLRAASTLPADYYNILGRKNIFSRNRITFRQDDRTSRPRGPVVRRVYTPVLIGAMAEDDGFVAFIVDPESHNIVSVRPGDTLPSSAGTLKEVTLDSIITDPGSGKPPTRVLIGQNILGGAAEYPDFGDAGASSGDTGSAPATTADSHDNTAAPPAAGPAPSGGSVDDIVERLRKRRQAQFGSGPASNAGK